MKRWLPLVTFSLFGCSSILGLDDFSDAPGSGGAAGAGAAPGGGGAAGGGGVAGGGTGGVGGGTGGVGGGTGGVGGGTGGVGGSKWKCVDDAAGVLVLVTAADADPFKPVPDSLVAVSSQSMGHVGFTGTDQSSGKNRFFVRTLSDSSGDPLGSLGWYEGAYARMTDGLGMGNKSVAFFGTLDSDNLSRITFQLDPSTGVKPMGNPDPLPSAYTPAECAGAKIESVAYNAALGAGTTPAFTCVKNGTAALWLTLNGTLTKITETTGDVGSLSPAAYSIVGNVHLIVMKDGSFRFGSMAPELVKSYKLAPTNKAGWLSGAMFAVPTSDITPSSAVAIGTFEPSLAGGELFSGTIPAAKYGDLAKTPIPGLPSVIKVTSASQISNAERRSVSDSTIVLAGTTFTQDSVRFTLASRSGEIRVFNQDVYKPASDKLVLRAVAVQVGAPYFAVAWAEKDKASGAVSIRAKRLVCGE